RPDEPRCDRAVAATATAVAAAAAATTAVAAVAAAVTAAARAAAATVAEGDGAVDRQAARCATDARESDEQRQKPHRRGFNTSPRRSAIESTDVLRRDLPPFDLHGAVRSPACAVAHPRGARAHRRRRRQARALVLGDLVGASARRLSTPPCG